MASKLIQVDGSQGEGGGQIVRSSLALAIVTGQPVRIEQIRAGREKPGLMRQHLMAVRGAQQISNAKVSGDTLGSSTLTFEPGEIVPGDYQFAVGTAGSATLVLQTVLPPLLIADRPSRLVLEGGTHNPWAPPFDFLLRSFLPLLNQMGPGVNIRLERHGFYPAGGGRIMAEIDPASKPGDRPGDLGLSGFHLPDRGEIRSRRGRILLANLPDHIAERELKELARLGDWDDEGLRREPANSVGPGNAVIIEVESTHVTEVFSAIGSLGVKAETVVQNAIGEMDEYLQSNVPVGPHLADQLLLPLGLCAWQTSVESERRQSSFRTMRLTDHSRTHIAILKQFLGISIEVDEDPATGCATITLGSPPG